eukprot:8844811-Prorocentrum_lima.AAC.1
MHKAPSRAQRPSATDTITDIITAYSQCSFAEQDGCLLLSEATSTTLPAGCHRPWRRNLAG